MTTELVRYFPRPPGCTYREAMLVAAWEVLTGRRMESPGWVEQWNGAGRIVLRYVAQPRWDRCPDDGELVATRRQEWSTRGSSDLITHLDGTRHQAGVALMVVDARPVGGERTRHAVLDVEGDPGNGTLKLGPGTVV